MTLILCLNRLGRYDHPLYRLSVLGILGFALTIPAWTVRAMDRGAGTAAGDAAPAQLPDPDEDEDEKLGARQALRDNCLICHSVEMIEGQRLTSAQWKAEVEKMIGFGSPLPADKVDPLIKYLSGEFSESTPSTPPARITKVEALAKVQPQEFQGSIQATDAGRGASLSAQHCGTCHGLNGQGADLGPNLVEVAVLLRPADFLEVVRNGRHRMPGFKTVLNVEQEADILAWLRSRRYETPLK